MKPSEFLTPAQQEVILEAVRRAEKGTSGEIRVHIDSKCSGNPVNKAERIFTGLGMHCTVLRNGVLIYLACQTKVFAIVGDQGINDVVPEGFWDDVAGLMSSEFKKGSFAEGLSKAVTMIGEKLSEYFPYQDGDINEQPDEISFGGYRG